jgi:hypothetical protein
MITAAKKQRIKTFVRTTIEALLLVGGLILITCETNNVCFSIATKIIGFAFWFILAKMTKNDPVK